MEKDCKVFVGQPIYLGAHPVAILGGSAFASEVPGRCVYKHMESAFHCGNFNALWCTALNSRKELNWTHFAMLHQDINPIKWWVDRLLHEMDEAEVDLLSVVIPLKDDKGVSSTAILNKDTLCTRRLTMTEVVNYLPPTFISEDLPKAGYKNHLLLHGSGMFLARFDKPWVEKVWFEAPSRVCRDQAGNYVSCIWDEGWNLSVQMYNLGLKIACTRVTPADHLGGGRWGNENAWGEWLTDAGETNQEWALGKKP